MEHHTFHSELTVGENGDRVIASPLKAGEKGFAVILLLLGAAAFGMSLKLWVRMEEPRVASAAAMPLFVSGIWVVTALLTVLENRAVPTPLSGCAGMRKKFADALRYALPPNVLFCVGAIICYCVLLILGVSFYLATPLFLYGCMRFLMRGDSAKNIVRTALVMAFIVLVFRLLLRVVFP